MKTNNSTLLSSALLATLLAAPAFAAGLPPQDGTTLKPVRALAQTTQEKTFRGARAIQLLALETNVQPQDVRMIARTIARKTHYQFGVQRDIGQRFADALGSERFDAWSHGRPVALYSPAVIDEANRMAGLSPQDRGQRLERVAVNP